MEIAIKKESSNVIISIIGRLDTAASIEFSNEVDAVLAEAPSMIEFDCEKMDYVASSGLRTFLNAYKKITPAGGKLKLVHVQPAIMSVLKMTGFTGFLSIE